MCFLWLVQMVLQKVRLKARIPRRYLTSQGEVVVQTSAHGTPAPASLSAADAGQLDVSWHGPHQRVAPGQSVVFYDEDRVLGGGTATA